MNRLILLLLFVFLFTSCNFDKTEQITVASQKADCIGVAPQKCFLIKTKNDRSWQYFSAPIEGFAYEPGNEYILMVKRKTIKEPTTDQPSFKYVFVKEITKKKRESADLPRGVK